jgi:hypothetical protein
MAAQQRNGGWGEREPTAEETAYALLTLCWLQFVLPQATTLAQVQAVKRGRSFLQRHFAHVHIGHALPTLWVDKSVYAPHRVVRAATLAALYASDRAEL